MTTPSLIQGVPAKVDVDELMLDPDNPRLASHGSDRLSQNEILRVLWSEMAVDEVAFSIAANGFYPQEALFVIRNPNRKEKPYVVIEGNRRLAAVLLLREESRRKLIKATDLPKITAPAINALATLPVVIFENRRELWAYLGFRHVNGTKPWDALSKAEFVAGVHEKYRVSLKEIAERIGDRHSTVARFYRGYAVLQQAEEQTSFARSDLWRNRFYFSHLYTALDQPEFQRFVGIKEDRAPARNPIPKGKLRHLEQLLLWLYGRKSDGVEPVVRTQNPDLNHLRRVLAEPHALSLLRQGFSLEHAFEVSEGDAARFRDSVVRAKDALQKAKGTVTTGYEGDSDLLSTMEDVVETAGTILEEMRKRSSKKGRASR